MNKNINKRGKIGSNTKLKRFMLRNASTKLLNTPLFSSWDVFYVPRHVPQ